MKPLLIACLVIGAPACFAASDSPLGVQTTASEYARRAHAGTTACIEGEIIALEVALGVEAGLETDYAADRGQLQIRYRMAFKHVTEGWNWHPEAVQKGSDYYVFKYLPLGSVVEDKGSTTRQDADGVDRAYVNRWQYDYFFTFDNPDDFYARGDDEAGFVAEVALPAAEAARLAGGDLRMALRGRLASRCVTESNTYWSGLPAKPVDFTLRKRYLIGKLTEVVFYDGRDGKTLARLTGRY